MSWEEAHKLADEADRLASEGREKKPKKKSGKAFLRLLRRVLS